MSVRESLQDSFGTKGPQSLISLVRFIFFFFSGQECETGWFGSSQSSLRSTFEILNSPEVCKFSPWATAVWHSSCFRLDPWSGLRQALERAERLKKLNIWRVLLLDNPPPLVKTWKSCLQHLFHLQEKRNVLFQHPVLGPIKGRCYTYFWRETLLLPPVQTSLDLQETNSLICQT